MLKIDLEDTNILYYLLSRGFCTKQELVSQQIWIERKNARNKNFVIHKADKSFMVKQVRENTGDKIETLRKEACVYWLVNNNSNFSSLKNYMPALYNYDYDQHVLISEYLEGYDNIYNFHNKIKKFPAEIGKSHAHILASYQIPLDSLLKTNEVEDYFPKNYPWSFKLPTGKPEWFGLITDADKELYKIVQNDALFKKNAQTVIDEWERTTLIHGDLKWVNFLIKGNIEQHTIKLIDWEIADLGDPAWDIAGIIQCYISMWFQNYILPAHKQKFDMDGMELAFNTFWNTYTKILNINNPDKLLIKSMRYAAFRNLQSTIEYTHSIPRLTDKAIKSLQLSQNILKSPENALAQLLGVAI